MSDLFPIIENYSIKHDKRIKDICSPLNCLNIQVFTYGFIEADGRFGYISNSIEFNEYYFSQKLFLDNPYFAHPTFFRSGYALCPCSLDDHVQQSLKNRFQADHLLLSLQVNESFLEFFIFANEHVSSDEGFNYLPHLNQLNKFSHYFKKEANILIGRMRADQFNIKTERGSELFETHSTIPLATDPKTAAFLKKISGLSPQEQRCLALFQTGNSAQATAALMNLSQRTVEHYFDNIKNKLGCGSKYDLLNY